MGSGCTCQSSAEDASDRIRPHRQGNLTFFIHERLVSGKGCKKTPAWQTSMTKEEIDGKVKEFWETRVEGSPMVWTLLQQACNEPEPEKAEELLKTYGMTLNNGMIQQTYDERGYRYDLPPFVINPAVKYGETRVITRGQIQFKKETLTLLFRSAGLTDCKMTLTSDETVESVKKKCVAAMKIEKNIRLFFDGKELKDDKLLGNYPISSNMVVQVFLKYS